jgi:hypothetical protein
MNILGFDLIETKETTSVFIGGDVGGGWVVVSGNHGVSQLVKIGRRSRN